MGLCSGARPCRRRTRAPAAERPAPPRNREFARFFEREADQAKPQASSGGAHSFRDRMRMFENKASKGTSGGAGNGGGSASASKVKKINTCAAAQGQCERVPNCSTLR